MSESSEYWRNGQPYLGIVEISVGTIIGIHIEYFGKISAHWKLTSFEQKQKGQFEFDVCWLKFSVLRHGYNLYRNILLTIASKVV